MKNHTYNSSPRLISLLERKLSTHLKFSLKHKNIDLTVEEFRTLFYLWHENGLTQNQIAEKAFKEKSLITKTINSLEGKNLICRKRNEQDKRNKQVFLTQNALDIENQVLSCAEEIILKSEKNITESDMKTFLSVLIKMKDNLS